MIKFDVQLGNPPYQPPDMNQKNRGKIIWDKFVEKTRDLCSPNGYICLVHPSKWRCPDDKLHTLMFFEGQIRYLEIHDDVDGRKTFGVPTRYDWYILQKKINNGISLVKFEDGKEEEVQFSTLPFLPNFAYAIWKKSIALSKKSSIKAVRDQRFNPAAKNKNEIIVNKNQNEIFKYPLIKSVNSEGATFYWSKECHPLQNKAKIVFSNGRFMYPTFDNKCGVCEGAIYILIDENDADIYIRFLKSKLIKLLIKSTKWNNFRLDEAIFKYIPNPISIGVTSNSTDNDIYNCFGLNEKEKQYVASNITDV